jgi:enoyl-CoA hydratase/carnithine racemase
MDSSGTIKYTVDDPVGIVTLDHPPENSLSEPDFLKESELEDFIHKNGLKGLVFTGAGRHFSSGADLQKLFETAGKKNVLQPKIERGKRLLQSIEELDIPVIAAVDGICFGGGFEIALACHIRICGEKTLFAFPEVNHNMMPGLGGIRRLSKLLKGGVSYEMIIGGDMVDSATALELNIVDHVVASGQSLSHSVHLLKSMVHNKPRDVIQAITRAIYYCRNKTAEEAFIEETRLFCDLARKEAKRSKNESA